MYIQRGYQVSLEEIKRFMKEMASVLGVLQEEIEEDIFLSRGNSKSTKIVQNVYIKFKSLV